MSESLQSKILNKVWAQFHRFHFNLLFSPPYLLIEGLYVSHPENEFENDR